MLGSRLQIKIGSDSSAVLTVNEFIADAPVLARARLSELTQMRKLDCATIRVSKTTHMSGMANADEINRGGQIGKRKKSSAHR